MNIKKLTLSVVAVLAFVGVVSAQQSKTDESVEFRPHWNLQLQGGIASTIGESSSFGDMISSHDRFLLFHQFLHGQESGWDAFERYPFV